MSRPKRFREMIASSLGIPKGKAKFLPSGFQRIGNIVILNLKPQVYEYRKDIGEALLERYKYVKTVAVQSEGIRGELREPSIQVVAGQDNTVTTHRENGCKFRVDVSRVMFSKGNLSERGRIPKLVRPGETIVDMFAGIGYFSIPIAKHSKPFKVYSIEKNPASFSLLKENIKLNNIQKSVTPVLGDCRVVKAGKIADRVIMGYLPKTYRFLQFAFSSLKKVGGTVHYHDTYHKDELWEKPIEALRKGAFVSGYELREITHKAKVKEYSPNVFHVVLDAYFVKR
jgi:tRNA wybutosine-synthesizing protein 2